MSKMKNGIYKALWVFMMIIANIYDTFRWLIQYCKHILNKLTTRKSNEIEQLENCKLDLTKLPKHLSIIIGNNQKLQSDVISKLIFYSLICDINYISFFDITNHFTLDQINIPKFISTQKIQNSRFLWSMPRDKTKSGQLKYKNGLEKTIEVVTLTNNDGKPLLAEICKELYAKRTTKEVKNALNDRIILNDTISQMIKKKLYNLPDPELIIIFDKTMCTYGLLPWNTGFSEFHRIDDGYYFNIEMYANILYKFSKCEQRFGK